MPRKSAFEMLKGVIILSILMILFKYSIYFYNILLLLVSSIVTLSLPVSPNVSSLIPIFLYGINKCLPYD
jgi:hypothetical protein